MKKASVQSAHALFHLTEKHAYVYYLIAGQVDF